MPSQTAAVQCICRRHYSAVLMKDCGCSHQIAFPSICTSCQVPLQSECIHCFAVARPCTTRTQEITVRTHGLMYLHRLWQGLTAWKRSPAAALVFSELQPIGAALPDPPVTSANHSCGDFRWPAASCSLMHLAPARMLAMLYPCVILSDSVPDATMADALSDCLKLMLAHVHAQEHYMTACMHDTIIGQQSWGLQVACCCPCC